MLEDDVYIREARPEEAESLCDLAYLSRNYWDYPEEWVSYWFEEESFPVTQEYIEKNPTYLIENEEEEEILGFYSLQKREDKWMLPHLWVIPEHIGDGYGGALFLHACETAEALGAEFLFIITDSNAEAFFCHMGAEKIEEKIHVVCGAEQIFPILRIRL
ncbi:MAG: GNAT family N-acetyltransferase [Synergistaceae bacterium]|jgi:N-acetylglutamate synthase-like GNAT family acetyltransferase|nr:GNAT family N-acetyltransferase [Synergistaceae bacterium]MBP9957727.1 GNAT family N-acetyltransferase [Synergistaceae bacterium]